MATYNLNYGKLESLLHRDVSRATENAIIHAIQESGLLDESHGKITVDLENTSGAYALGAGTQLFLDTGTQNAITISDLGRVVVASGDGSNSILDTGPGGDTMVGGDGEDKLQVSHGENLLIAGAGQNTLVGGDGNDTLIGGGDSYLQAGSGGSTLIGGLGEKQSSGGGDDDDDHGQHFGRGDDRDHGGHDHGGHDHGGHDHGGQGSSSGSSVSDTLAGGAGSDLLTVYHGNNVLIAGSGSDTINGGDGSDTIFGGGTDTINLNSGNEVVFGGDGTDLVKIGLHGNDVIYGGAATTVQSQETSTAIAHEIDVKGVTVITFADHQVLTLSKVTIDFADGVSKTV